MKFIIAIVLLLNFPILLYSQQILKTTERNKKNTDQFWVYAGYLNYDDYSKHILKTDRIKIDKRNDSFFFSPGFVFHSDGTTNDSCIMWNNDSIVNECNNISVLYSFITSGKDYYLILKDIPINSLLIYKSVTKEQYLLQMEKNIESIDVNASINDNFNVHDKTDYKFIDDPDLVGEWTTTAYINDISEFPFEYVSYKNEYLLKKIYFYKKGGLSEIYNNKLFPAKKARWTNGRIIDIEKRAAARYFIKSYNNEKYLLLEWKNNDYTIRYSKPGYYVLVKSKPVVSSTQLIIFLLLAAFFTILFFLIRNIREKQKNLIIGYQKIQINDSMDEDLGKVTKYLANNFTDPDLDVKKISDNVKLPAHKIPKIIKKTFNLSFPQYLNVIRITEAKRLLVDSNLSIIEIAMTTGYNNVTHFNRLFKCVEGTSPNKYRKKFKNCK